MSRSRCRHLRAHDVTSCVTYDEGHFLLDVKVVCADCKQPFEFVDGIQEARLSLQPPKHAPLVAGPAGQIEKRN